MDQAGDGDGFYSVPVDISNPSVSKMIEASEQHKFNTSYRHHIRINNDEEGFQLMGDNGRDTLMRDAVPSYAGHVKL